MRLFRFPSHQRDKDAPFLSLRKKIALALSVVLLGAAGVFAFFFFQSPPVQPVEWAVYIYMCGSDLESLSGAATTNLAELISTDLPADAAVIVQTGGSSQWMTPGIRSDQLQRWRVTPEGLMNVDTLSNASMGDSRTLESFLSFCRTTAPAKNEAVVLWNHGGGGVYGVCFDENYDNDALTLEEVQQALKSSCASFGRKFSFIGFDACLMSTLETAVVCKDYADYMVASEETSPQGGWDYRAFPTYFQKDALAADICTSICDDYLAKCMEKNPGATATMAVTDLSRVDNVLTAFDGLLSHVQSDAQSFKGLSTAAKAAGTSKKFGGTGDGENYSNLVDLQDFAEKMGDTALPTALTDAIFHRVTSPMAEGAKGLSFFYPIRHFSNQLTDYLPVAPTEQYRSFLQDSYDVLPEETISFSQSGTLSDGKLVAVAQGLEYLSTAEFTVYGFQEVDEMYSRMFSLGSYGDVFVTAEGTVSTTFDGKWPTIGSTPLYVTLVEEREGGRIFTAPILLNGEKTNLRFLRRTDGTYEILGTWKGIDAQTGVSDKGGIPLSPSDVVTPMYQEIDPGTMSGAFIEAEESVSAETITIVDTELPMEFYQANYVLTDIFGTQFYSAVAIMEKVAGGLTVTTVSNDVG